MAVNFFRRPGFDRELRTERADREEAFGHLLGPFLLRSCSQALEGLNSWVDLRLSVELEPPPPSPRCFRLVSRFGSSATSFLHVAISDEDYA